MFPIIYNLVIMHGLHIWLIMKIHPAFGQAGKISKNYLQPRILFKRIILQQLPGLGVLPELH